LAINYHIGKALIENNQTTLSQEDLDIIFSGKPFEGFMTQNFSEVYYFKEECMELDLYRQNIEKLDSDYKKSLALILMRRAMVRKMPYSRFTINWEKIKQLRDEEYSYRIYKRRRHYHNQSFEFHFRDNLEDYNNAIFDNGKENKAYNLDIYEAINSVDADVIYLDPPYAGTMNDYFGFYGLLDAYVKNKIEEPFSNNFIDVKTIGEQFDRLFSQLSKYKYWMISYNSRSKPSKEELLEILSKYSSNIEVHEMPYAYKVTGKEKKQKDVEYLFIVKNKML
jgi:adenine-specific DNA-methyltransferase